MKITNARKYILILALIILSGEIGYNLGKYEVKLAWQNWRPQYSVINRQPPSQRDVDFELFWDVWDSLSKNYIDKSKLDPQQMVYGAITGMTKAVGDPYTVFLPPEENKAFKADLGDTKFEGIGAQLGAKDSSILIVAPLKGSPAESAGIKAGDVILKVGSEETIGWTVPEVVAKIRGPKGTKIVLTILRENETKPKDIEIIRDTIIVKSVEWSIKESEDCKGGEKNCKVVYLKLSRFGDEVGEWNRAIDEIRTQLSGSAGSSIKGLVFDLRNNPGGYLSGAVLVASEFLKEGTVVQQENAGGQKRPYVVEKPGKLTTIPMIVIINKGSASASEIVAGALKENNRAELLGEKSFGKGSIQEAEDVGQGAGLHITTAKWLLPSGKGVESGLVPDIEITASDDPTKDPQLQKAIETLVR
ncbi:S41 family peptidase [Candidatus Microgenomates bacterium]|nr:S41 family peptidase [Candidatus Microgenomates bacterium]